MKKLLLILYIIFNVIGCTTFFVATLDSPPSNINQLKIGLDRKSVDDILGKPKEINNNVYTYEFSNIEKPSIWPAMFFDVVTVGTSAVYYGDLKKDEKAHKIKKRIVFSPNNKVVNLNYDLTEGEFLQWLNISNRESDLGLLCTSANNGHAYAQAIQAMRYHYGLWDTEIDRVKAYLWIKLADFGGRHDLKGLMTDWANNMTSKEIDNAEKLFFAWEPGLCKN